MSASKWPATAQERIETSVKKDAFKQTLNRKVRLPKTQKKRQLALPVDWRERREREREREKRPEGRLFGEKSILPASTSSYYLLLLIYFNKIEPLHPMSKLQVCRPSRFQKQWVLNPALEGDHYLNLKSLNRKPSSKSVFVRTYGITPVGLEYKRHALLINPAYPFKLQPNVK
ncbi:hypothetical protein [Vampirovibrio chlorellavorus]|uniref:hypothetical protein n=1 Tax=Vampirovibrio chlorellavorus TaxID=758823 RepID=UPI0026F22C82|nr:hypothetical protein [Vampirovibrio chlorellavorus]